MWLLDHNLPQQLREFLLNQGIQSDTAAFRGWGRLRNGELLGAAAQSGYVAIITRDVKFAQSAAKSLPKFPKMAIVIIRLPQRSAKLYLEAFSGVWASGTIVPVSGQVTFWPE